MNFPHQKLVRMTEKIALDLHKQNKLTCCVTVKLRYSNFETYTKQLTTHYTNADHVLLKTATELFNNLDERRILIRLIGIRFTNLKPGNYQIQLFEDTQEINDQSSLHFMYFISCDGV